MMQQRVFVALLTIVVFCAGYGVRLATETQQHVPAPPPGLVRDYPPAAPSPAADKAKRDLDRAKLYADIQKMKPQIEAFSAQVGEIYAEFDREFALVLDGKQREKFVASQKRNAEMRAERDARRQAEPPRVLTDEEIRREQDRPMWDIYRMMTIMPRLEWLTKEYGLDAAQQTSARALLSLRRNKFIALLDATPHPSIQLSRLAPMMERVMPPQEKHPK